MSVCTGRLHMSNSSVHCDTVSSDCSADLLGPCLDADCSIAGSRLATTSSVPPQCTDTASRPGVPLTAGCSNSLHVRSFYPTAHRHSSEVTDMTLDGYSRLLLDTGRRYCHMTSRLSVGEACVRRCCVRGRDTPPPQDRSVAPRQQAIHQRSDNTKRPTAATRAHQSYSI